MHSGNHEFQSNLNNCCTTPDHGGVGNITNAPLFVNEAAGDFHLQANSPCINSGKNTWVLTDTDLDGSPRIVAGTVDIGAYEFQSPGSPISYAWLQSFGLPTDGSADNADPDGDGLLTWQEWVCGTNPTNALSALRLLSVSPTGDGVTVKWQSVAGVNYFVERSSEMSAWTNSPTNSLTVTTNVAGQSGITTWSDLNASGLDTLFYRVGVRYP